MNTFKWFLRTFSVLWIAVIPLNAPVQACDEWTILFQILLAEEEEEIQDSSPDSPPPLTRIDDLPDSFDILKEQTIRQFVTPSEPFSFRKWIKKRLGRSPCFFDVQLSIFRATQRFMTLYALEACGKDIMDIKRELLPFEPSQSFPVLYPDTVTGFVFKLERTISEDVLKPKTDLRYAIPYGLLTSSGTFPFFADSFYEGLTPVDILQNLNVSLYQFFGQELPICQHTEVNGYNRTTFGFFEVQKIGPFFIDGILKTTTPYEERFVLFRSSNSLVRVSYPSTMQPKL